MNYITRALPLSRGSSQWGRITVTGLKRSKDKFHWVWAVNTGDKNVSQVFDCIDINYPVWFLVQSGQTDRRTDRKWCIWSHNAKCTGGLKKRRRRRIIRLFQIILFASQVGFTGSKVSIKAIICMPSPQVTPKFLFPKTIIFFVF